MSQPPPLAPISPLTSNSNSKKRNATQSGMTNDSQHQPPTKRYKTAPIQYVPYPQPMYPIQHNIAKHPPYSSHNTSMYPLNQNYHHSTQSSQYTTQHNTNNSSSKQQYHRTSPTPQLEMVDLKQNHNDLPQQILIKINNTRNEAMISIGTCSGFLFGPIEMAQYAHSGEVIIKYKINKSLSVYNTNDIYLGQCDNYLLCVFAEFIKNNKMKMKANITETDVTTQTKRKLLSKNKFGKKLLIKVFAQHDIIFNIVQNTRKKEVKKWKWIEKEVILSYFEGIAVEYTKLYNDIMDSMPLTQPYNEEIFESVQDLEGIDPFQDIIKTKLLQHQRIGLEWMILRETIDEDDIPPFFREIEDRKYINILNNKEYDNVPSIKCGGICADDMGLGKTLQCISLIASNSDYQNNIDCGNGPTLIVAPLTVIGNWVDQIKQHCAKDSFKIMVYHGPNREKDLDVISAHNIVITTFDIVRLEYCDENDDNREEMKKHYGCGLQYIEWLRVVLDEAHKIRSMKTRVFKACNALQSKFRWCLSGTPVQNRLDDLYSLFCFLKLQPICDKLFWNKFIMQPINNNNSVGFERLRTVMKQWCLRRDKTTLKLPDKVIKQRVLEFSAVERKKYLQLLAIHKAAFNRMKKRGDKEIMRNYSSVLTMLLRLRQCCAHILLLPEFDEMILEDINIDILEDANQECSSCGMKPEAAILSVCNHIYCSDCFNYELETNNGSFPCFLCGDNLSELSIMEKKEKTEDILNDKDNKENKRYKKFIVPKGRIEPSTKMQQLINDVKSWKLSNVEGTPNKAVVFSQWISVLDLLGKCLDQEDILFERLDGTMSRARRESAMEMFRNNDDIQVFLMSLKAGNLGVNMTVANHVYMVDPWWNPATEDQAVDRVYRLGQERNVVVNHFVINDSVEEKILKIQERKRKLISSALGQSKEDMKQERSKELLEDLKEIFTSK